MSELAVVALALATALGAAAARPWPLALVAAVLAVAALARWPWLLVVGAGLLASTLGARALAGAAPVTSAPVAATATLLGDPVERSGAVRVEVRVDGRHFEAWGRGPAGWALARRQAGEAVQITGRMRPPPDGRGVAFARRHLVGRIDVAQVGGWTPGPPVVRAATRVRETFARGAEPLGHERAALLAGLVLGDDRGQDPVLRDDVDAAGLTHMLAVSGQNVAFVLALCGPVLRRLRAPVRLGATLAVVGWFALLTRGEPSVLRATAMASVSAVAAAVGRPAGSRRILALAVAAIVLVDPLLVWSVGFQLSVAASAAIVVLAPGVARRLPGPRWLAEPMGVVIAAQLGVTPVAVPLFGGLPVASLPANVLVGPVTGPITMWGLTGGVVAGLVGPGLAGVLHLPTAWALAWLEVVARVVGRLPLGSLQVPHVAALVVALVLAGTARRTPRALAGGLAATVLVAAALAAQPARVPEGVGLAGGARLWQAPGRSGPAGVLVVGQVDAGRLLGALRSAGVERLDVVVLPRVSPARLRALAPVLRRYPPRLVLAPPGGPPGARVPRAGEQYGAGPFVVEVLSAGEALQVDVRHEPSGGPGGLG